MKWVLTAAMAATGLMTMSAQAGGGLLGAIFGSLDDSQANCQASYPGNYLATWACIRADVARGHAGNMRNGAALKYMATGDMLASQVRARKLDDATALYHLANALSAGDLEYSATHPVSPDLSVTCHNFGYTTVCN